MPQIMTGVGPIHLRYDNILVLQLIDEIQISEADVREILIAICQLTSEKLPLIVIAGIHSWSIYAQRWLAKTQAISKLAMVLGKEQTRDMYQFFSEVLKPVYELKIFYALNEAIAWLKRDAS